MDDPEELLFDNFTHSDYVEVERDIIDDDDLLHSEDNLNILTDCEASDDDDSILLDRDSESDDDLFRALHDDDEDLHDFSPEGLREEGTSHLPGTDCRVKDRQWVISQIEQLLERIIDGLLSEDKALNITLKSRSITSKKHPSPSKFAAESSEPRTRDISFPGATPREAWNFTVLLRILELVHDGLINNTIATKRDLYYRHPDLFIKQTVVDRYVDDLAYTLDVSRAHLNVTAASKGLVAGNFTLVRPDGYRIEGTKEPDGILIPNVYPHDCLELDTLRWILVIEKEAAFRSILGSPQWETLSSLGVILTAKGYPDLASRRFLRRMNENSPEVPIYALVDLDPDGIAIMSTYKYGSRQLAHEETAQEDMTGLSLPSIRWLGVKTHHLSPISTAPHGAGVRDGSQLQGWMQLTTRDRDKALKMLNWSVCSEDGAEPSWRRELQNMVTLNRKAEMQILDEMDPGLVPWLAGILLGSSVMDEALQSGTTLDDGMLF